MICIPKVCVIPVIDGRIARLDPLYARREEQCDLTNWEQVDAEYKQG